MPSAFSRRCSASTTAACTSCCGTSSSTLLATLALMVVTGYLYVTIPKGFFPQQDTGFIFGQAEARQDTSFEKMTGMLHRFAEIAREDPAVSGVFYFGGAAGVQPDREHRPDVHPAQAARRARRYLRPGDPPAAAEGGAGRGRQILYAVGAGYQRRRPAEPHAIPVHADRHRYRRAEPLGADRRGGDAEAAGIAGRRLGSADRRALYRRSRSTAMPPRASGSRCRWSTRHCTTRSASGRSRRCTPRRTSTRSSSASSPSSRKT